MLREKHFDLLGVYSLKNFQVRLWLSRCLIYKVHPLFTVFLGDSLVIISCPLLFVNSFFQKNSFFLSRYYTAPQKPKKASLRAPFDITSDCPVTVHTAWSDRRNNWAITTFHAADYPSFIHQLNLYIQNLFHFLIVHHFYTIKPQLLCICNFFYHVL